MIKFTHAYGLAAGLSCLVLAACGGGASPSGETFPVSSPTPAPAPLPTVLSIAGPAEAEAGAAVRWQSNLATGAVGQAVQWSFGDGATSTALEPSHTYAGAAVYKVTLTVRNSLGASRLASHYLRVKAAAAPQGGRCSQPGGQGWCWQTPSPWASPTLNDWHAVDASQIWAVGNTGSVVRTRDGGRTWVQQASGTEADLGQVRFWNARVGWIYSKDGRVLRTTDAGNRWVAAGNLLIEPDLADLLPLGDAALIVTDRLRQKSFVTVDGGQRWTPAAINVFLATRPGSQSVTLHGTSAAGSTPAWGRSTDGGATFARHTGIGADKTLLTLVDAGNATLFATVATSVVDRFGALTGYVAQELLRSTDDGATWSLSNRLPDDVNGLSVVMRHDGSGLARPMPVWDRDLKKVLRTTDGGATWRTWDDPLGLDTNERPEVRYDADRVEVTRPDGARWVSTDMGRSWVPQPRVPSGATAKRRLSKAWPRDAVNDDEWLIWSDGSGHVSLDGQVWYKMPDLAAGRAAFSGLWFSSDRVGVATTAATIYESARMWDTQDGGRTWLLRSDPISNPRLLQTSGNGIGWLLGSGGLYRSQDQGRTWGLVNASLGNSSFTGLPVTGDTATALSFSDSQFGWVVANESFFSSAPLTQISRYQTTLRVTVDGGLNWRVAGSWIHPSRFGRAAGMFSADLGLFVDSDGRAFRTTDGGASWPALLNAGLPESVAAQGLWILNANLGWIYSAERTWRTQDGGRTWTASAPFAAGNWTSMQFADPQRGWLVGRSGRVMATSDGGQTWVNQPSGALAHFGALFALDAQRVWLGGDDGTVLTTNSGGR